MYDTFCIDSPAFKKRVTELMGLGQEEIPSETVMKSVHSAMTILLKSRRALRRLQLLSKFAGTVTAVLDLWLSNFGWANVVIQVRVF